MNYKKSFSCFVLAVILFFGFNSNTLAALTIGSTSLSSNGALSLVGTANSIWDLGSGNTLSIQTSNNGPVTFGSGLLTATGGMALTGTLGLAQGNGSIVLGSTGGDSRNSYAVDIQTLRDNSDQVASGLYSITVGSSNKASNTYSSAFGRLNNSTNLYTTALGYQNSVSGLYGTAVGYQNSTSANFGLAVGYQNTANMTGSVAVGNGLTTTFENSMIIGPSNTANILILSSGFTGISNTSPQSNLQVGDPGNGTNEFTQIDSINGSPQASECNTNSGRGRMIHDYTNHKLYICDGVSRSWDHIDLVD